MSSTSSACGWCRRPTSSVPWSARQRKPRGPPEQRARPQRAHSGDVLDLVQMFTKQIGIDLVTANIIVYVRGKGIVLTEPSMVALAHDDGSPRPRIVADGQAARPL